MQGRCQTKGLVYKATVSSAEGVRHYTGHTANTFKLRYGNHKNSFVNPSKKKKHSTALSTYMWDLAGREVDSSIAWSIVRLAKPYRRGGRSCDLCLPEKPRIANQW